MSWTPLADAACGSCYTDHLSRLAEPVPPLEHSHANATITRRFSSPVDRTLKQRWPAQHEGLS
jgi:hypothetical protein